MHSADVDYALLLPSLFKINAGYFLMQCSSERNKERVYKIVGENIRKDADGVEQVAFIGVINPQNPHVESPEEIAGELRIGRQIYPEGPTRRYRRLRILAVLRGRQAKSRLARRGPGHRLPEDRQSHEGRGDGFGKAGHPIKRTGERVARGEPHPEQNSLDGATEDGPRGIGACSGIRRGKSEPSSARPPVIPANAEIQEATRPIEIGQRRAGESGLPSVAALRNSQAVVSPNCHRFVETDPGRLIVRDGRRRMNSKRGWSSRPKSRSCWLRRTAGSRSSRPWWPSFCAAWGWTARTARSRLRATG